MNVKGSLEATTPMLSPENWERILSNLPPKDLYSAINTCPEWNQLMTPKKNGVLFTAVLSLLKGHLPLETILGCRQLSKYVNHATDHLLSNDWNFRDTLMGGTKIARFISLMESRPFPEENPIGRSVVTYELQTNRRVEAVRQVLARYGHHVRKFQFSERPLQFGILESYVSLLNLLPNLESITIIDCLLLNLGYSDLASLALPKLEKLEDLRLDDLDVLANFGSPCTFGLRFLDEYGHQLKSLSLDRNFLNFFGSFPRSLDSLAPNLDRFEMNSLNSSALKKLARVTTWKLEVLQLSGTYELESLSGLLAAVNNFANTLIVLHLIWNPGEVGSFSRHRCNVSELVKLPQLKMVTLLYSKDGLDLGVPQVQLHATGRNILGSGR